MPARQFLVSFILSDDGLVSEDDVKAVVQDVIAYRLTTGPGTPRDIEGFQSDEISAITIARLL